MTATEALERRIDELCRENERLRQDNDGLRELKLDRTDNAIRVQARRMGLSRPKTHTGMSAPTAGISSPMSWTR